MDDFEPVGWKMEPIASIIIIGDGFVIHLSGKILVNDDIFPMINSRLAYDMIRPELQIKQANKW